MVKDTKEIFDQPEDDIPSEIKDILSEVFTADEAQAKVSRAKQVRTLALIIANNPEAYETEEEIDYAISIVAKNDHEKRIMEDIIEERIRNRKQ